MSDIDVSTLRNEAIESEIATLSAQNNAAEHRLLTLCGSATATTAWRRWRRG